MITLVDMKHAMASLAGTDPNCKNWSTSCADFTVGCPNVRAECIHYNPAHAGGLCPTHCVLGKAQSCKIIHTNCTNGGGCDGRHGQLFYSEADFVHHFAEALGKAELCLDIDFEYPYSGANLKNCKMDMLVMDGMEKCAVEFKYRTAEVSDNNGYDILLNQRKAGRSGVATKHRARFYYDIYRLEQIVSGGNPDIKRGYAIFLTNDKSYWEKSGQSGIYTYDGYTIPDKKQCPDIPEPTKYLKGEITGNMSFTQSHEILWNDYLDLSKSHLPGVTKNTLFKYTIVEVVKPSEFGKRKRACIPES